MHVILSVFTALALTVLSALAASAEETDLDTLFDQLQTAEGEDLARIENEIWGAWSASGSPAMDLLLKRGKDAMDAGDYDMAIKHLTALVDHAPDFAEGWNARATAYFHDGQFGPSIEDIRHVLALNPRHFGALSGLAIMLEEIGKPQDALVVVQEIEKINPHQEGLADWKQRLVIKTGGDLAL